MCIRTSSTIPAVEHPSPKYASVIRTDTSSTPRHSSHPRACTPASSSTVERRVRNIHNENSQVWFNGLGRIDFSSERFGNVDDSGIVQPFWKFSKSVPFYEYIVYIFPKWPGNSRIFRTILELAMHILGIVAILRISLSDCHITMMGLVYKTISTIS